MHPVTEQPTERNIRYLIYASAAWFGMQLLLRPGNASASPMIIPPVVPPAPGAEPVSNKRPSGYGPAPGAEPEVRKQSVNNKRPSGYGPDRTFPLKQGMQGPLVAKVQEKLGLKADGKFGPQTAARLKSRYGVSQVSQELYRIITEVPTVPLPGHTVVQKEIFPLTIGKSGAEVKQIQTILGIKASGTFDLATQSALLRKYGISSVSSAQYTQILQVSQNAQAAKIFIESLTKVKPAGALIQKGSKGAAVERLQLWLGFAPKKKPKKGVPTADGVFGQQTEAALKARTGKTSITTSDLNLIAP